MVSREVLAITSSILQSARTSYLGVGYFFFSPRSVITEHSVRPTYSEKCYLCCAGMFSSPRVAWLCLLILIRTGTVFTPCSKSSFSPGYDHLCLETQAVALVSTSDYLCARISGICILFFQIQAFKY